MNLCSSVLRWWPLETAVAVALAAGYRGLELRVHEESHRPLARLEGEGPLLARQLQRRGLPVRVLNAYLGVDDEPAVAQLLEAAQRMEVPRARVVLPRSRQADIARRAQGREIIPSYAAPEPPRPLIESLRRRLGALERQARAAGVKVLLELHWGTVMSSFSGAYLLTSELDPACVGITFDPANMVVEGREDWEFGLELLGPHVANVHVKNAVWATDGAVSSWRWAPLRAGLVDWHYLLELLARLGYGGEYAMEDFLVPDTSVEAAVAYLLAARQSFEAALPSAPPAALAAVLQ